jgi:hypothetical protein
MKNVNFIKVVPPHIQYEIRRFFWFSLLLFMCTVTAIIITTFFELHNLYTIKQKISVIREKTKNHTELTKNHSDLKKKHEELQNKITKIGFYKNHPKNPHDHLNVMIKASANGIQLEQIRFNKNDLDIIMLCSKPETAASFVQHLLATEKFSSLALVSLQKDEKEKMLRCAIKGVIKR